MSTLSVHHMQGYSRQRIVATSHNVFVPSQSYKVVQTELLFQNLVNKKFDFQMFVWIK